MASAQPQSADRDDIIAQFQGITGLESVEECVFVLEASRWDLNMAVESWMSGNYKSGGRTAVPGGGGNGMGMQYPSAGVNMMRSFSPPLHPQQQLSSRNIAASNNNNGSGDSSGSSNNSSAGSTGHGNSNNTSSIAVGSNGRGDDDDDEDDEDDHRHRPVGSNNSSTGSNSNNGDDDGNLAANNYGIFGRITTGLISIVSEVINLAFDPANSARTTPQAETAALEASLRQRYGDNLPTLSGNGFPAALTEAARRNRFLLVYLHSSYHPNAEIFCRDVLCTDSFAQFVNSNFVFWAGEIKSSDAYRLNLQLVVTTYPFLALLSSRDRVTNLLDRIEGPLALDAAWLVGQLTTVRDNFAMQLHAQEQERAQRDVNRMIREEQDADYQRSLLADQEKERRAQEEVNRRQREEQQRLAQLQQEEDERARKLAEEQRKAEERVQRRAQLAESLPAEPPAAALDSGEAIFVAVRLPDGRRQGRRYYYTDRLQSLLDWVHVQGPDVDEWRVVSTHPRREFSQSQGTQTFRELGFEGKSVLLNFEPL